jgi:hypothetical protein
MPSISYVWLLVRHDWCEDKAKWTLKGHMIHYMVTTTISTILLKLGYPERCHNHCFNFNCFRLHYFLFRLSFICKHFEVLFQLNENKIIIYLKKIEVVLHLKKNEVVFHFQEYWGYLPFSKILRLSSNFKSIEVVCHCSGFCQ